jgi:hypothetical protein
MRLCYSLNDVQTPLYLVLLMCLKGQDHRDMHIVVHHNLYLDICESRPDPLLLGVRTTRERVQSTSGRLPASSLRKAGVLSSTADL